ncbi:fungal-specific transcription factor domain-containing protein [Ilyonectria destructans]|nr:fungal-specific transcription factor domain-containing protein [Ilyonectria destructans]
MPESPPSNPRPSRNRRHITTACGPCRVDKIKCDGANPECRQCTTKHRTCTYTFVDKRKLSLRKAVEVYSQRLKQLESFIALHNLDIPRASQIDEELLEQIDAIYGLKSSYSKNSRLPLSDTASNEQDGKTPDVRPDEQPSLDAATDHISSTTDIPQPIENADVKLLSLSSSIPCVPPVPSAAPLDLQDSGILGGAAIDFDLSTTALPLNHSFDVDWVWNHSLLHDFADNLDVGNHNFPFLRTDVIFPVAGTKETSPYPSPSTPLVVENDGKDGYSSAEDEEDHSAVTNQLSARLGSLLTNEHGERHFYGATSILNLARDNAVSSPYTRIDPDENHKRTTRLESAGLNQHIGNDLVDHLLGLFFTYHNPNLFTVDRSIFNKARDEHYGRNNSTSFFSLFLQDAMCAVGALFETRKHPALPYPLTEFFAARAISSLDLELGRPRVATVQALAILSSHEASCTHDSQGWLFSGMAVRIAIDLGLHVSTGSYVDAGSMSVEEARGRSVAFWGSFAIDRMWSLYLGRPSHNVLQFVTAETPISLSTRHQASNPPGSRNSINSGPPDPQETIVEQWIQLLSIMSALEGSLYFQVDASNLELQKLAQDTWNRLRSWRCSVPSDVDVDTDGPLPTDCSPDIFILHMLYEYLAIVLHRPFVAKHYIQPHPLLGKGPQHARDMCIQSACRISTLLSWYQCRRMLSQTNIQVVQFTFSAALILIYATVSENNPQSHQQLSGHLETCCQALAHLGDTFANASRTLDVLLQVKRTWQARLVTAAAGRKRCGLSSSTRSQVRRRTEAASSLGSRT